MSQELDGWVNDALDTLAADDVHVSVPTRVQSAVLNEWDRQHLQPLRPRRTPDWKRRLPWVLLPAAAAAVLAVAALQRGAAHSKVIEMPRVDEVVRGDAAATTRFSRDNAADLVSSAGRALQGSPRDRSPRRLSFGNMAADGGYVIVPVPLVDPAALNIVRARMSRMALATLGVPIVNPDADGLVEVEMLVGDDGVAQSIRYATLVSEQLETGGER
jgi:hypothetical protein